jgi:hypothetical protein
MPSPGADRFTSQGLSVRFLLWAFGYIGTGMSFLSVALKLRSVVLALFSLVLLPAGIWITVNAFAGNQANETNGQKNQQKSRRTSTASRRCHSSSPRAQLLVALQTTKST